MAGHKILQEIAGDFSIPKEPASRGSKFYEGQAISFLILFYFNVLLAVGTDFSIENVSLTIQCSEK